MENQVKIIETCSKYSMVSTERLLCNINSIKELINNKVFGDIVECGVWKGGSMLSMMLTCESLADKDRMFHLYDTFAGMTKAGDNDVDLYGNTAQSIFESVKCEAAYEEVRINISSHCNISPNKIFYHVGDIMKTSFFPEKIALLRLDTDFYDSTKFELDNFYDKVVEGGIIIIDDYGHWSGCKKAVDEFLSNHLDITLNIIDYTGVWFYKPKSSL